MRGNGRPVVEQIQELENKVLAHYGGKTTTPRYLSIEDPAVKVRLLEGGKGKPVIFVPALNGFQFAPLIGTLEEHYHLFLPDPLGFGLTDAFDYRGVSVRDYAVRFIRSLMDELGIEEASLVGNSMGGYWCLLFALAHPERVDRVVLPGGPFGVTRWLPRFLRLTGTRGLNRFLWATIFRPSRRGTRIMHKQLVNDVDKILPDYLECEYLYLSLPTTVKGFLTLAEEVTNRRGVKPKYSIRNELGRITTRTLFIWGDKDTFVPVTTGWEACKVMPNARIEVVEDAGHLPWLDDPEICGKLLVDFLNGGEV